MQWLRGPNHDVTEELRTLEFEGSPEKTNDSAKNNKEQKVSCFSIKEKQFLCGVMMHKFAIIFSEWGKFYPKRVIQIRGVESYPHK